MSKMFSHTACIIGRGEWKIQAFVVPCTHIHTHTYTYTHEHMHTERERARERERECLCERERVCVCVCVRERARERERVREKRARAGKREGARETPENRSLRRTKGSDNEATWASNSPSKPKFSTYRGLGLGGGRIFVHFGVGRGLFHFGVGCQRGYGSLKKPVRGYRSLKYVTK